MVFDLKVIICIHALESKFKHKRVNVHTCITMSFIFVFIHIYFMLVKEYRKSHLSVDHSVFVFSDLSHNFIMNVPLSYTMYFLYLPQSLYESRSDSCTAFASCTSVCSQNWRSRRALTSLCSHSCKEHPH